MSTWEQNPTFPQEGSDQSTWSWDHPSTCTRKVPPEPFLHFTQEATSPLTFAFLIQALFSSPVPAGQAEPCQQRLQHYQVTVVKGQVTVERAWVHFRAVVLNLCVATSLANLNPSNINITIHNSSK